MSENERPAGSIPDRQLDMESLKALAHPLRVQILDTLSTYGQFTASGLAERLGESSGATSYHLRQLERHGFVREVDGRGTGRERWWERMPGAINLDATQLDHTPASLAASKTIVRQWARTRNDLLNEFQERGIDLLPTEWLRASDVSTVNLKLTVDDLKELSEGWMAFIEPFVIRHRGKNPPGSRPVQIHFNAFPVVDGEVTPDSPEKEA
jgi:DNA-binding transcriptional ArsR family regulator